MYHSSNFWLLLIYDCYLTNLAYMALHCHMNLPNMLFGGKDNLARIFLMCHTNVLSSLEFQGCFPTFASCNVTGIRVRIRYCWTHTTKSLIPTWLQLVLCKLANMAQRPSLFYLTSFPHWHYTNIYIYNRITYQKLKRILNNFTLWINWFTYIHLVVYINNLIRPVLEHEKKMVFKKAQKMLMTVVYI